MHRSSDEDKLFHTLTYMFLSDLYILISSARLYGSNFDDWDALGMYYAEEWLFRWCFDCFLALSLRQSGLQGRISLPVVIELDETGIPISSGLLPLQSVVKNSTMLPRFEDRNVIYEREFQETKAMTGGMIALGRKKRGAQQVLQQQPRRSSFRCLLQLACYQNLYSLYF